IYPRSDADAYANAYADIYSRSDADAYTDAYTDIYSRINTNAYAGIYAELPREAVHPASFHLTSACRVVAKWTIHRLHRFRRYNWRNLCDLWIIFAASTAWSGSIEALERPPEGDWSPMPAQ